MATAMDFKTANKPTWCPGCGNYGILTLVRAAMARAELEPHMTVVVGGIGCSGKMPHYLKAYGFEGIHGRVLPIASGVRLANPKLKVIGFSGDGDAYGIGLSHFLHAARRNIDITYIVHNNQIYGLTTGQTSPTSLRGSVTKSTPSGSIEEPVVPLALALSAGAGFVSRCYVGETEHAKAVMVKALQHKGFSLVDVFQPCVTFNKVNTYAWFNERVTKLEDDPSYDPSDKSAALSKALSKGDGLPIGVFYRETRPTYEEQMTHLRNRDLTEIHDMCVNVSGLFERCR